MEPVCVLSFGLHAGFLWIGKRKMITVPVIILIALSSEVIQKVAICLTVVLIWVGGAREDSASVDAIYPWCHLNRKVNQQSASRGEKRNNPVIVLPFRG